MQISWNWMSELVDLSSLAGPEALAALLTDRGLEVEELRRMDQGLDRVISAQIVARNPHPQADRLSVCQVDPGDGVVLEIVCGAQNMKTGDKVALAQVGAQLPNGLKIAQSKIRGVISNGMLCSESELGLKEVSEGILILPASTVLGKPIAELLGRDDVVFTLKLTANRGDCLSHRGLAREIASALGQSVKVPEIPLLEQKGSPIAIHLEAGIAAPQFFGCLIEGVKVGPSPEAVKKRLETLGLRSINNIVDTSNLVMLELGHPVHAYDADRIEGKKITVRVAQAREKLPLLDGTEIELGGSELVIADGTRAIGLAGVMGGGNSEVQDSTVNVYLECAEFDSVLVRRAKAKHQKQTDAAHRFERGIDRTALSRVISRFAAQVIELAGGKVVGAGNAQIPEFKNMLREKLEIPIVVDPAYFNRFLGNDLPEPEMATIFKRLECKIEVKGPSEWRVYVPAYRQDLKIKEDLAEELARSIGYDKIPSTIPKLTTAPTAAYADPAAENLTLLDRAKDCLVRGGLLEVVNFGFTSQGRLAQYGMNSPVRILNPLSEEHEYLVPSLLPGLIENALQQWRHHFGSDAATIRVFELRPTFSGAALGESATLLETGITENWKLAFAVSGPRLASGLRADLVPIDFSDIKSIVESLMQAMGTKGVRFLPVNQSRNMEHPVIKLLHPGQAVEILAGNQVIGCFGLLHPGKSRELKARGELWIGEIDWTGLVKMSRRASESSSIKKWSEFPPMERDFALLVKDDVAADKINQVVLKAGRPLAKVSKIFDVYRGSQVPEGMTSVAVRVIFFDEGRSLQEIETDAASAQIVAALQKELGAQLRS